MATHLIEPCIDNMADDSTIGPSDLAAARRLWTYASGFGYLTINGMHAQLVLVLIQAMYNGRTYTTFQQRRDVDEKKVTDLCKISQILSIFLFIE